MSAAKLTHEEELAKYNASHANHVPSEGTSKMVRKEVEPAAKPEKKVASVSYLLTLRTDVLTNINRNHRSLYLNQHRLSRHQTMNSQKWPLTTNRLGRRKKTSRERHQVMEVRTRSRTRSPPLHLPRRRKRLIRGSE